MSSMVVLCFDLKLSPGRWNLGATLNPAFEAGRQADKLSFPGREHDVRERLVEISASCPVAIPKVVIEKEVAICLRLVGKDDSWRTIIVAGN
jgi:hypothetical protein